MLNTLLIFNNRQVKAVEVASTPNYPYISLDSLRQVEQYLTPDIEVVLKTKEGLVLLNCLDNEEDRQAIQNLLKQEKKEKGKEVKTTGNIIMSTISKESHSQLLRLAIGMVSSINREQELKDLIIEKTSLVEKLIDELKQHEKEYAEVKTTNREFKQFSKENKLSETLQKLLTVEEGVDEAI